MKKDKIIPMQMNRIKALFRKFVLTTNHEKSTFTFSSIPYTYIYAAGGTSLTGHDSWLSHACASGLSFLPITFKDNHK